MTGAASKLATYDDLLRLPEDVRGEIVAGEIVTAPAPLPKHSKAQGALRSFIGRPFDDDHGHGGPGGWWIFIEVDVRFGPHDIVRPDLAGWRRERLSSPGESRPIDVPPDWVCEILSPSTATLDRVTKRNLYARHSVGHYWIVDVEERTLEAFALSGGTWMLLGAYDETSTVGIPPFSDVELDVGRLFLPQQSLG